MKRGKQLKITEAVWEKRNLGVSCLEIELNEKDTVQELEGILAKRGKTDYIVVKCPVCQKSFLWELPAAGFTFIETQVCLSLSKENFQSPPFLRIAERNTSLKRITDPKDIGAALDKTGEVFDTDRISLDQYFCAEQSGARFRNWAADMIGQGDTLLEFCVGDEPAGFFIARTCEGQTGFAGLAGMYPKFKGKGYGAALIHLGVDYLFRQGHQKIVTCMSSNNKEILKIHFMFGFQLIDLKYVYVRHGSGGKSNDQ